MAPEDVISLQLALAQLARKCYPAQVELVDKSLAAAAAFLTTANIEKYTSISFAFLFYFMNHSNMYHRCKLPPVRAFCARSSPVASFHKCVPRACRLQTVVAAGQATRGRL